MQTAPLTRDPAASTNADGEVVKRHVEVGKAHVGIGKLHVGIALTYEGFLRTASIDEATPAGSTHIAAMVEAPPTGSALTLQGFVHVLAGLVRVAEVVESKKADRLAMAEASAHTPADLARVLHPIVQKKAGLLHVAEHLETMNEGSVRVLEPGATAAADPARIAEHFISPATSVVGISHAWRSRMRTPAASFLRASTLWRPHGEARWGMTSAIDRCPARAMIVLARSLHHPLDRSDRMTTPFVCFPPRRGYDSTPQRAVFSSGASS
jgi:hypothetical protein